MVYHAYNKSIAGFVIFNSDNEYKRMVGAMKYYQTEKPGICFSRFLTLLRSGREEEAQKNAYLHEQGNLVQIVAYCLMPTHLHLLLREIDGRKTEKYSGNILNSYTRYFNIKYKRKGPLWEGRTKKVPLITDEQLLHLTRYIHLNPVTANIVKKPEDWPYSSYNEYLMRIEDNHRICDYDGLLDIDPCSYKGFVDSNIGYQKELAKEKAAIKNDIGKSHSTYRSTYAVE